MYLFSIILNISPKKNWRKKEHKKKKKVEENWISHLCRVLSFSVKVGSSIHTNLYVSLPSHSLFFLCSFFCSCYVSFTVLLMMPFQYWSGHFLHYLLHRTTIPTDSWNGQFPFIVFLLLFLCFYLFRITWCSSVRKFINCFLKS